MPRFADLEARINAATVQRLSNCAATVNGQAVQAIFDNGYAVSELGLVGMAGSKPALTLPTSSVPPQVTDWFRYYNEPFDPVDVSVAVNGVAYTIVAHEPDGTGLSRLLLEVSA